MDTRILDAFWGLGQAVWLLSSLIGLGVMRDAHLGLAAAHAASSAYAVLFLWSPIAYLATGRFPAATLGFGSKAAWTARRYLGWYAVIALNVAALLAMTF